MNNLNETTAVSNASRKTTIAFLREANKECIAEIKSIKKALREAKNDKAYELMPRLQSRLHDAKIKARTTLLLYGFARGKEWVVMENNYKGDLSLWRALTSRRTNLEKRYLIDHTEPFFTNELMEKYAKLHR